MQGVTVIESFSKAHTTEGIILAVVVTGILAVGIVFIALVVIDAWRDKEIGTAVLGTALAVLMIAYIVFSILRAVTAFTPVEYKRVKVDPSANYWEFTQRYEIVEQDGDIYTVTFKEEA